MKFESVEHAYHYASGQQIDVMIYKNKVIDVSEFKYKHPGGQESINKWIGKDISLAFDRIESHGTKAALRDLETFSIGEIKVDNNNKPILTETKSEYDIDLKKGVLWQVFKKLNLKEYLEFIHDPKHMINPPEAIMFETNFLEFFTKTPWYAILIIWIPLVLYNLYYAYFEMDKNIPVIVSVYFFGIFLWTLCEYVLHRFFFHLDEKLPDNNFAILIHFLFHGIHHAFPMDKNRLVFPPVAAYPLYKIISFLLFTIFGYYYKCIMSGVLTGYILYDMTHYFIHHNKPAVSYWKELKAYHVLHHYKNPKLGFGVSNKLWDYAFDTVLYADSKKTQ